MDGSDLEVVVQAGEQLFTVKLLLTAVQYLWLYEYLLNLGDEIRYVWPGRKSWAFALYIGNRYTPLVHFIWVQFTMFHYEETFCEHTKWIPTFHSGAVTTFAQTVIAIRIYAITGMNKLLGCALAFVIFVQLCSWMFSLVWIALGPLQPLPDVNLDPFKICIYKPWQAGEIMYYVIAMSFDFLAFSIIVVTAIKAKRIGYPTMPSILQIIVQDAIRYFLLIFSAHILSLLFLFVAPVNVQLMPSMANTTFVPVMASRLMLSLKKVAAKQKGMGETTTNPNLPWGRYAPHDTLRFASWVPGRLPETALTSVGRDKEGIELDAVLRPPRSSGSLNAH